MGGVTESRIERRGESDAVETFKTEVFDFFLKSPLIESDLEEEEDFVVVDEDDEDEIVGVVVDPGGGADENEERKEG